MVICDILDGQKIKSLDDLYYIDACGEDDMIDTNEFVVQLTGTQLKNNFTKIADAGDIGVFNVQDECIDFFNEDGDKKGSYNFYYLEDDEEREFNETLFELVD